MFTETLKCDQSSIQYPNFIKIKEKKRWLSIFLEVDFPYHIYGLAVSIDLPPVTGWRNRRSEWGIEIILTVVSLPYWIGISLDHMCEVMQFFTGLGLSKSQANSLLEQLSNDWEHSCFQRTRIIGMALANPPPII